MSNITQHLKNSETLLESLEAIKNYRAYIMLALSGVLSVVLFSMFAYFAMQLASGGNFTMSSIVGVMGTLITAVFFLAGFSATGILLMDQAKGNEIRSIVEAFFAGLFTLPRIIGLFLLLGLLLLAALVLLVVMLFICKIPGIGPVLYAFVFPISVVLIGGLLFAYATVIAPLSLPAIWDGNGVTQVVARLFALVRSSLLPVLISEILLFMLVGLTAVITFGVISYGMLTVPALSMMILPAGDMTQMLGALPMMMMGMGGGMKGGGYLIGAGFGGVILFMAAIAIPLLTQILGNCIIYLNLVRHLEIDHLQSSIQSKMNTFKEKAVDARNQFAQQAATLKQPPSVVQSASCPECKQSVADDEVFCSSCGCKLK